MLLRARALPLFFEAARELASMVVRQFEDAGEQWELRPDPPDPRARAGGGPWELDEVSLLHCISLRQRLEVGSRTPKPSILNPQL